MGFDCDVGNAGLDEVLSFFVDLLSGSLELCLDCGRGNFVEDEEVPLAYVLTTTQLVAEVPQAEFPKQIALNPNSFSTGDEQAPSAPMSYAYNN